jgi:hypothetical protein
MSAPTIADYAASYVSQFGMALVPLPPRTKRPLAENWGKDVITDPDQARAYYEQHPDWNMGAALGPSRICSFDVDDIDATRMIFEEFGWDLDALRDNFPTIQGSPGGFRVMFSVPEGANLQYRALTWPKQDRSRGRFTVWEIRAADTQQRQDVLPPSIHPDTQKPYVWLTKPKATDRLPTPPDFLLQMWQHWEKLKPQLQSVCPWAETPTKQYLPVRQPRGDSVIDAFNHATGIEASLTRYGYRQQGKRYLSPHSSTGLAGVIVWPEANKCFIHHASDPLCSDESGQPVGPFDLLAYYDHGGDMKKAAKAAAEQLGMTRQRQAPPSTPETRVDPDTGEIFDTQPAIAAANDNQPVVEPIDIFAEIPVPPIRREMLPDVIANYAFDNGELIGVEPAMIAIPALVAFAAALHDGIQLQVKRHEEGWRESARLWCAVVGNPSIKKSPSIKRATSRLRKIDGDLHDINDKAMAKHMAEQEAYKEAKKEAKKTGESVTAPEPPKRERMVVEDVTVEALSEVLKDNARGVLCVQDELSGWFGSMDAYSGSKAGGKDRAHWLEAYNGGGRVVDRVMRGSLKIPNWSVSMIGGIQPDAIRRIAQNMTDDGLMQRFMIIVGSNAEEFDREADIQASRAYSDLIDHLFVIAPSSNPVTMTEDAHQVREALNKYATNLANYPAMPGGLKSHLGKWSGLFARLALLFHAIECHGRSIHPCTAKVSGDTARRVDTLMRKFLLPHAMAYYTDVLGAATELEHARWIAGHVLSKNLSVITLREIQQAYRPWRGLDDWRRTRVMQTLEDMGWLTPIDDDRKSRRGAHTWAVNMAVHHRFAEKAQLEAETRERMREEFLARRISL